MIRYILVEWPESQEFMGQEGCYYCNPGQNEWLDLAMFVPEDLYKESIELDNTEYDYGNDVSNKEYYGG